MFRVDDVGALVVYAEVTNIGASARGYNVGMNVVDGPKLALAITLIE